MLKGHVVEYRRGESVFQSRWEIEAGQLVLHSPYGAGRAQAADSTLENDNRARKLLRDAVTRWLK
ncbi:MAG: hypothetical protein JWM33_3534 [Caulobacteraceae bacterium]|nr:hypothetical protein [Caulobacteraceae bacterium]